MKKGQAGFSVAELLIIIIIVGIFSTIAIPNFLSSKRSANEASAISTLRILHFAGNTYQKSIGKGQVPSSLNVLFDNGFVEKKSFSIGKDYHGAECYIKNGYGFNGTVMSDLSKINFSAKPIFNRGSIRTGTRNFMYVYEGELYYYYSDVFSPVTSALVEEK